MGGGKSVALVMEAIKLSLKYPGNYGFMCRKTFQDFRKTTMLTFFEFVPRELIKEHNKADALVTLINGSKIQFGDLEDPNKIKSMNLGWFAIDEASDATYQDFMMLVSRLRYKPRGAEVWRGGILATNPEPCWIKDLFLDKSNPETFRPLNDPDSYQFISALPSDNPHNPDDYVKMLRDNFDDEWVKKYVEGNWTTFKGLVYKDFNKEIHVKEFDIDYNWNLYRTIDYGVEDATVCLFIGVDSHGKWWIFDEYYSAHDQLSTRDHVENILIKYPSTQYRFMGTVGDTHALGKQLAIDSRTYGLPVMYVKNHKVTEGIDRIKAQLKITAGEPLLYIHPRCVNLIREFGRYAWKKQINTSLNPQEKPEDSQNHCVIGESLVHTVIGDIQIKDLVGRKDVYIYSMGHDRIEVKKATDIRLTRKKAEVWKLTYKDGSSIIATPDHLIMKRNGEYIKLKDLEEGDSLMPFYNSIDGHGHVSINCNNGKFMSGHRMVYNDIIESLPKDSWSTHNIHHEDKDKLNNHPTNLKKMTRSEHCKLHQSGRNFTYLSIQKMKESLRRHYLQEDAAKRRLEHINEIRPLTKAWHKTENGKEFHKNHAKNMWKNMDKVIVKCTYCGKEKDVFKNIASREKKHYCNFLCRSRDYKNAFSWKVEKECAFCGKKFIPEKYNQIYCQSENSYNCTHKAHLKRKKEFNHKVSKIEFYGYRDVYNMEVEDNHNFACNGIIIHNCVDSLKNFALTFYNSRPLNEKMKSYYAQLRAKYNTCKVSKITGY